MRQAPIACGPQAPLGETLRTMEDRRIGSMPIVDGDARPLGIFTRQDVIGRVVLPQRPLTTPMREVMSAPAITLPADGDRRRRRAADGATRHPARRPGRRRRRRSPASCPSATSSACSGCRCASSPRRSVAPRTSRRWSSARPTCARCRYALVAQGVAAGQLTRMISSLNDQLAVRILELVTPKHDLAGLRLCWLGMGSEGRGEQTIATDQDNGLIFAVEDERPRPRRRARAAVAGRAGSQRGDGPLRLSAVQGWRDGDEPALVREPRRVEGRVRQLDRPRRSGQPAGRQRLLRLPPAVGRLDPGRGAARRHRRARRGECPVPEADVRQCAAQPAAA